MTFIYWLWEAIQDHASYLAVMSLVSFTWEHFSASLCLSWNSHSWVQASCLWNVPQLGFLHYFPRLLFRVSQGTASCVIWSGSFWFFCPAGWLHCPLRFSFYLPYISCLILFWSEHTVCQFHYLNMSMFILWL